MDEHTMRERIASARVGRLATADSKGRPHVVPFCFVLDGEVVYWAVDEKPKRAMSIKRLANITESPRVEMVVDHYDDDWTSLWWVRASGLARVVVDQVERTRALRLLQDKYTQYAEHMPRGDVVAIAIDHWSGWQYAASS